MSCVSTREQAAGVGGPDEKGETLPDSKGDVGQGAEEFTESSLDREANSRFSASAIILRRSSSILTSIGSRSGQKDGFKVIKVMNDEHSSES